MRGGRFFCVALPLILCIAAIIALLYGVLAGVAHRRLYMFSIDVSDLKIDASDAVDLVNTIGDIKDVVSGDANLDEIKQKIADKLPEGTSIDDLNLDPSQLENLDPNNIDIDSLLSKINGRRSINVRQDTGVVTASSLGLSDKYEVTLWGYCSINSKGDRTCTKAQWNWAEKQFNTTFLDELASQTGLNITLPKELHDALDVFKPVTKWTQIGFAISLGALGIELLIGIFANCTRVISCLVWLWASLTTVIVIATAALATVTASVVVGAVESTGSKFDAHASVNTSFLATIWIGAGFAAAAGLFWIFTICCCKPESRSDRKQRKRFSDGEKLLPGNQRGAYGQLHDDTEMRGGMGGHPSPGYNPGFASHYNTPQYPQTARSDLAYEPYTTRA